MGSKKERGRQRRYVKHPRFGDRPIPSGHHYGIDEIEEAYWAYDRASFFPQTAIPADISKQDYAVFPRTLYVDIEKQCIDCGRWFIFHAREQQYWYEVLGFFVDADCTRCIDCRKKHQTFTQWVRDYETLSKKQRRTQEERARLKRAALELFQQGYIRNKHKLDNID